MDRDNAVFVVSKAEEGIKSSSTTTTTTASFPIGFFNTPRGNTMPQGENKRGLGE